MKKIGLALLIVGSLVVVLLCTTAVAGKRYFKLAVHRTSPVLGKQAVDMIGRFDLLNLDLENWVNNPEDIKLLKKKYPHVKVFTYVNPMEVFYKKMPKRPLGLRLLQKVEKTDYEKWFLWTTLKKHALFYTPLPMWMMNMTTNCPIVGGMRWNQFIALYYQQQVFNKEPKPDGMFHDNAGADMHWNNQEVLKKNKLGYFDSNLDGVADSQPMMDEAWKAGQEEFISIVRKNNPKDFVIVGNKGKPEYAEHVYDGKMFEHFPFTYGGMDTRAGGWFQCMENIKQTGPYSIIQTAWPASKKHFMFVFASALLTDCYFAVGHNNHKWFPEYDRAEKLGKPVGLACETDDYWTRSYENGIVIVWPYERKGEIILFDELEELGKKAVGHKKGED